MGRIGIWEKDEGLYRLVREKLSELNLDGQELIAARHPAELSVRPLELLVISPTAIGWAGADAVNCRMVLLPGSAGPLARAFEVKSAISYGNSPRDTLTISSLEGEQLCVAVQRELVTVSGGVVDRQELVLRVPPDTSPLTCLAAVGALLLLEVPAEALADLFVR